MRRIALFSDVHANIEALDAVLGDIAVNAIDEVYCLGDLVGYGPDPVRVIETLRGRGIPTIQGNYDEGIGTRRGECGCYYATEQAKADGAASYTFTVEAVGDEDARWLRELPGSIRLEHDGARVLLSHGSPRKINEYLLPDRSDEQLARLAAQAEADLVCVGHIHIPYHRSMPASAPLEGLTHYVSSGSAGKPKDGDPRACWVEVVLGEKDEVLEAAAGDEAAGPLGVTRVWAGLVVHRVAYDIDAVADKMVAAGLPHTLVKALRTA